jgi:hypothetical protein
LLISHTQIAQAVCFYLLCINQGNVSEGANKRGPLNSRSAQADEYAQAGKSNGPDQSATKSCELVHGAD